MKEKTSAGFTDYPSLLVPIALVAIAAGIAIPTVRTHNYNRLYNEAHGYAVSFFGDKKSPMEVYERDEWLKSIGVKPGEKPTRRQLRGFIDDCIKKLEESK